MRNMLTVAQASQQTGVSASTITNYIREGSVQARRFGRTLLLDEDQIAAIQTRRARSRARMVEVGTLNIRRFSPVIMHQRLTVLEQQMQQLLATRA